MFEFFCVRIERTSELPVLKTTATKSCKVKNCIECLGNGQGPSYVALVGRFIPFLVISVHHARAFPLYRCKKNTAN